MVLLEAIGLAAAEVFEYNRESFESDQEQRIKRDLQRVEMQITRFDLFRQDIEDLVKLTVDKMDMYHLIGALFLAFTTMFYTIGRIQEAVVPPFYLGMYFLSVASALSYLLLAVWLSMHASICAHSFGVRLRTRYVRLPIPSLSQIASLAAKLADFEKTGIANIMRLPFSGAPAQSWGIGGDQTSAPSSSSRDGVSREALTGKTNIHDAELLGRGQEGFAGEDVLVSPAVTMPGRHVQLFRKLQAKWQCFDAYARVSMALGVNMISQSIQYYLIGVLLLQRKSVSTAAILIFIFNCASLGLSMLDIAGLRRWQICCLQFVGAIPVIIVYISLVLAPRDPSMVLDIDNEYILAPFAFLLEAFYFEGLLWLSRPSTDEATLPRRFRTVLFLDVFGDAANDPADAELDSDLGRRNVSEEANAAAAERVLEFAWMALRRWEAVPEEHLLASQVQEIRTLRSDLVMWRQMLKSSLTNRNISQGRTVDTSVDMLVPLTSWADLTMAEKASDPFAYFLLGPLANDQMFDIEEYKQVVSRRDGQALLPLEDVKKYVNNAETAVRKAVSSFQAAGTENRAFDSSTTSSRAVTYASGDARPHQTDRLPWKTMRRLTRMLQFSWLLCGVLLLLQLETFALFKIDFALPERKLGRRLQTVSRNRSLGSMCNLEVRGYKNLALPWLELERVDVAWPYGTFFQPTSLACLSEPIGVLVGSPFALHKLANSSEQKLTASPIKSKFSVGKPLHRGLFPAGAVPLCAAPMEGRAENRCLWGSLQEGGFSFWAFERTYSYDDAVFLPLKASKPWLHFTGAILTCRAAALLQPRALVHGGQVGEWCLILAGWDGEKVPLAIVALPGDPSHPPSTGSYVASYVDAPLAPIQTEVGPLQAPSYHDGMEKTTCSAPLTTPDVVVVVKSLHLQAGSGRLWALLGGEVQAWDLLRLVRLGRWRTRWRPDSRVVPVALCEDARATGSDRLVVAASGPAAIFEARLPELRY